jgi:hypothetical protein
VRLWDVAAGVAVALSFWFVAVVAHQDGHTSAAVAGLVCAIAPLLGRSVVTQDHGVWLPDPVLRVVVWVEFASVVAALALCVPPLGCATTAWSIWVPVAVLVQWHVLRVGNFRDTFGLATVLTELARHVGARVHRVGSRALRWGLGLHHAAAYRGGSR